MSEMNTQNEVFDWDDYIEIDSPEWFLLPEGDYDFTVTNFERARYSPGTNSKIPACNQAIVYISIDAPEGTATIQHNLYLCKKCEGMLSAFFAAIGQKKHGERAKMNWNAVIGSKGRCKVAVRTFTKKDGTEGKSNEIKKFYADNSAPNTAQKKWIAGNFG